MQLHDFSDGGYCILSENPIPDGRLLLHLNTDDGGEILIRATVRWRRQEDDKTLIGCEFLDNCDHHRMRDAVCPANGDESNKALRYRLLRTVFALLVLVAVAWATQSHWRPLIRQIISLRPNQPSASWPWQIDLPWRGALNPDE